MDVEEIFEKYKAPLNYFYKYYAMKSHKEIGEDLNKMVDLMDYHGWIKFGNHTNITPTQISPEEMTVIYRALERE